MSHELLLLLSLLLLLLLLGGNASVFIESSWVYTSIAGKAWREMLSDHRYAGPSLKHEAGVSGKRMSWVHEASLYAPDM